MLIEMRIYSFLPGKLSNYLKLLEKTGMPLQKKYLGQCLGYYTSEVGPLNRMVQIWGYDNASDRETRRAMMWGDPEWAEFVAQALPMIQSQENSLLSPTSFSPLPQTSHIS